MWGSAASGVQGGQQRAGKDTAAGQTLPKTCPFPQHGPKPVPTAPADQCGATQLGAHTWLSSLEEVRQRSRYKCSQSPVWSWGQLPDGGSE